MSKSKAEESTSPSAKEDFDVEHLVPDTPQTRSPSFRPAYADAEFLLRDELRPVRFQLELLKPDLLQQEYGIKSTVVVFGSTRIPEPAVARKDFELAESTAAANPADKVLQKNLRIAKSIEQKSHYYDEARALGHLITTESELKDTCTAVIITGSGNGIMEAANRGAHEAGGQSIGLNIVLPREQCPNAYVTPELSFQFQYFALRKMHFLMRAMALVVFPGGYGTLDELFETLTLIQTKKMKPLPVLLFGKEYWQKIIDFQALVDEGTIDEEDLELFRYVGTAREAWDLIQAFYDNNSAAE